VIIDGPNVLDLGIGAGRRIIQDGDSQLLIPPTLLPVLLNIKRTVIPASNAIVNDQSCLGEATVTANNSATFTTNIIVLAAGLWELEMSLCTSFDYLTAAGAIGGADITLTYHAGSRRLLSRRASVGTFVDYNRMRLLLDEQTTVGIRHWLTAVGEHADSVTVINAIRIL